MVAAVLVIASITVPSGAFTTASPERSANVGVVPDSQALVGVDLAAQITVPNGSSGDDGATCTLDGDVLRVSGNQPSDVDTPKGVIVESGARAGDVDSGGGVVVQSGGRINGNVDAEGCVRVASGARITGEVEAGGDVVVEHGGRIGGETDADGDVLLENGARIDGDVDAGGDVTLQSGARIDGDVEAGGTVTVANGARISGEVTEGSGNGDGGDGGGEDGSDGGSVTGDRQRLLTLTNNLGSEVEVTVTLREDGDGTLAVPGSNVAPGSAVTVVLAPGGTQQIDLTPTGSAAPEVGVTIEAQTLGGDAQIALERSVPASE